MASTIAFSTPEACCPNWLRGKSRSSNPPPRIRSYATAPGRRTSVAPSGETRTTVEGTPPGLVDDYVRRKPDVRKRRRSVGRGTLSGKIRARDAQKPAALREKAARPVVVGNAKALRPDNQRQRAWPELDELLGTARDRIPESLDRIRVRSEQRDRLFRLAALYSVEPLDCVRKGRMRGESVDSVRRDHRHPARKEDLRGGLKTFFITLYNLHFCNN